MNIPTIDVFFYLSLERRNTTRSMGNRQLPFDFQKVVCVYLPYPNPSSNQVPTPFLIRRSDVYLHLSKSYTEHILTSTIYTTGLLSFFHILLPQQLVNQWVRFMPHQNRWAISKTSNVQVVDWLHPSRWDPGPWLVFRVWCVFSTHWQGKTPWLFYISLAVWKTYEQLDSCLQKNKGNFSLKKWNGINVLARIWYNIIWLSSKLIRKRLNIISISHVSEDFLLQED